MGHQIYLGLKGMGDNSMSGKRIWSRSRLASVPQDPGDMVKPALVKPQSPCCKEKAGRITTVIFPVVFLMLQSSASCGDASQEDRVAMSNRKDLNEAPKSPYSSITYGRRDRLRDASPMVTETP